MHETKKEKERYHSKAEGRKRERKGERYLEGRAVRIKGKKKKMNLRIEKKRKRRILA